MPRNDILFLDPARRNEHGGKVFRLEDCTPDITQLYPTLMQKTDCLMLKLSPMLDLHQALHHLPDAEEVYVVAVKGEVKELLVVCRKAEGGRRKAKDIVAVNLTTQGEEVFRFTEEEENMAETAFLPATDLLSGYVYEPNAAILKAGAFRLIGQRYGLCKFSANTHLYHSEQLISEFPGRAFRILQTIGKAEQKTLNGQKANVLTRNYPLRPEDIRKKLKMHDGGEQYIIGARISEKPILLLAERCY